MSIRHNDTHPEDAMTREQDVQASNEQPKCRICGAMCAADCLGDSQEPSRCQYPSSSPEPQDVREALAAFVKWAHSSTPDDCPYCYDPQSWEPTTKHLGHCPFEKARAALRRYAGDGGVPEGWQLVPKQLTEKMLSVLDCEGERRNWPSGQFWQSTWTRLLAASRAKSGEKKEKI